MKILRVKNGLYELLVHLLIYYSFVKSQNCSFINIIEKYFLKFKAYTIYINERGIQFLFTSIHRTIVLCLREIKVIDEIQKQTHFDWKLIANEAIISEWKKIN